MENLFEKVPDEEPRTLRIGSFWTWRRPDITEAYPTATYTLKYRLTNLDDSTTKEITATKDATGHLVEVPSQKTATYTAGNYVWVPVIVRVSDSVEIPLDAGDLVVETSDPSQTFNYRVLVAIRATLEKTASKEQQQYSIAGRQLIRRSTSELLALEQEFQRRVEKERSNRQRKLGRGGKKRVLVKMGA